MRRVGGAAVACTLALGLWACSRGAGPLPSGAALGGLADIDKPESYTGATLAAGASNTYRVGAGDGISDPVQIHVGPSSLRRPFERRNRVEQQPEDHAGGVNRGR